MSKIACDFFGEDIYPGTILCLAENDQQKVGVVSRVIASNGNCQVIFYSTVGILPERIIKSNRVIKHADLMDRCVIVPLIRLNDAVTMYREIKEHATRLQQGVMRGVKSS